MRNLINLVSLFEGYERAKTLSVYKVRLEKILHDRVDFLSNAEKALQAFEDADPTPKKAFVLNLIKWYLDGSMRFVEDASKATDALALYSRFRLRPDMPKLVDLSFSELLDLGDKLSDTKSKKEEDKEKELAFYRDQTATLWLDNENWKVVIPHTSDAAKYFGRNTRWCTSAEKNNMFDDYADDGDLYIILEKKTNKRWQLHVESGQFMDELDEEVNRDEGKYVIASVGIKLDAYMPNMIKYITNPTETQQLIAVRKAGYYLRYFENPSEKVQLAAVEEDGSSIRFIKNPNEEVKIRAVSNHGVALQYIENPSEEVKMRAVTNSSLAITFIENPSEEVKMRAVTNSSLAIKFIENPSEEIQLAAIKNSAFYSKGVLDYIKNPSEKIKLASVTRSPRSIVSIINPSEEIKIAAVKADPSIALQYISYPSEEIKIAAVKADPSIALQYISYPSEELQLLALSIEKNSYVYISNPTKKVTEYYNSLK